jgi:hypothetical protein
MVEHWKMIPGFEKCYKVSDKGRVKSLPRKVQRIRKGQRQLITVQEKFLKGAPLRTGHLMVRLYKGRSKFIDKSIHRLVLETFIGPCPEGMECRHLDGNPTNNNLSNLCWGTKQENADDKIKHGVSNRGSNSPRSKLTEIDIPKIRKMLKELNGQWGALSKIGRQYNVDAATIRDIRDGITWQHVF